jgi:hypothetical protein
MTTSTRTLPYLLAALAVLTLPACDSEDADSGGDELETRALRITPPVRRLPPGYRWGACDLDGVDEPGWWGCNGSLGEGDACLRPVSDEGLSICVPQTWDPTVDDDCGNVDTAPFGLGVRLQGSAYCVPDCETDADCGIGRACSPASHFCAWVG